MGWRGEATALIGGALGAFPAVTIEGAGAVAWCHTAAGAEEILSGRRRTSAGCTARCAPTALPLPTAVLPSIALSFIGHAPRPAERQGLLAEVRRALATNGALVLLDHSRPRRRAAALAALARRPAVPGATPAARWRRLAYPAAREAQAAGFAVACLRLVAGERVQLVVATKLERAPPPVRFVPDEGTPMKPSGPY
jgi:SAM-dependent methyltransferase